MNPTPTSWHGWAGRIVAVGCVSWALALSARAHAEDTAEPNAAPSQAAAAHAEGASQSAGDKSAGDKSAGDVAALLDKIRPESVLRASFSESLRLPFLTEPLESTGTLTVRADGLIIRHVRAPKSSTLVMHGSEMVMRDDSGTVKVDVASTPEAATAVELLRALIVGDVADLKRHYAISGVTRAAGKRWSARLTPRRADEKKIFDKCDVAARGSAIEQITLYESDGSVRQISFDDPARLDALPASSRKLLEALGVDAASN